MDSAATLATSVYSRLRRDILRGLFHPGERLRLDRLGERYQIGVTPLREALNRLSAEDLVLREEQRGFRVSPVSLADLEELTKTCCWINELALREAIKNGDAAWEEAIVLAAHRLLRVPREGADGPGSFNPDWEERHRAFHIAIIAACGSRWLIEFYVTLMDRNTRYRYLAFADGAEPRDVDGEHQAIVEAVLARAADRAVAAANAHLRKTADSVVAAQMRTRQAAETRALRPGAAVEDRNCVGRSGRQ